jgi:hypothetical protein
MTLRQQQADLEDRVALGLVSLSKQLSALDKRVSALENAPKARKARKVAEPVRPISRKAKKSAKRSTPCNLNGCSRLFWSSVGANDHRCAR